MITVTIAGRLGKDAELRQTSNTQVCGFSVAADTGFGDHKQSHWFNCSLWGNQGAALAPYLTKGSQVTITGEYSEREYNGTQYKELRVNQIELQGSKQSQQQSNGFSQPQVNNYQQPNVMQSSVAQAAQNDIPQQFMTNNNQPRQLQQPQQGYAHNPAPLPIPKAGVIDQDVPFQQPIAINQQRRLGNRSLRITTMTNLSDFLKVKKVRCIDNDVVNDLTIGKVYKVMGVEGDGTVKVFADNGFAQWYLMDRFEPVLDSAENPLQNIELTPEFEAVEPVLADNSEVNIQDIGTDILDTNADIKNTPKFKVGDKVYFPRLSNKLCVIDQGQEDDYVDEVNGSKALAEMQSDLDFVYDQKTKSWLWNEKDCAPQLLHATPENHALLSKLYPHIEFEQPPKQLTGSDLARAMLERGDRRIYGYASDNSDNDPHGYECVVRDYDVNSGFGVIMSNARYEFFNPCDPRTGEPLTKSILNN